MHRLLHTSFMIAMAAACFALTSSGSAQAQERVDALPISRALEYEVVQYVFLPEFGLLEVGVASRSSAERDSNAIASFLNGAIDDLGIGYGDAETRMLIEDILDLKKGVLSDLAMYVSVRKVKPVHNLIAGRLYSK